ncbi:hypothetical protein P280DRAFT_473208 [Massarina eburnea CBS 473.64]|uniref:Uncharacterized protein n=1 Tax=Massarina eburnea CBS 473.64 TaxID=1395130 RepID=A0A6A6RMJ6_9PLEO|nr:hypothetical protein P280DRAFT_473208 [Massarina eburnea CBS 473.64]
MKLSWSLTLSSLYCAASAAREATVYMHDATPGATTTQGRLNVSPETARLILARRLGLSKFHSLEGTSRDEVQQLNVFGGRQPKLFGGDQAVAKDHELLWLEDVEDMKAFADCYKDWSSFTIANPPSTSDNDHLLSHLTQQARTLSRNKMNYDIETHSGVSIPNEWLTISRQSAKEIGNACPSKPSETSITVVLMPPSSSNAKRSPHPYGAYDLLSDFEARRDPSEAPLSLAPRPATSPNPHISNPHISNMEDFPVVTAQTKGNDTKAPLGILKRCYETKALCEKATNSCSGHGSCHSPTEKEENKGQNIPVCFACACEKETTYKDGKGMETSTKTIYWGGPACQKKDISVPFWLLTGTTVLLVFLITSGIGLLYSMGSEELPSVIGAGVSGPSRK